MRLDGDRLLVWGEAGLARDTAVRAWLRRWNHWVLKGASFLCLKDPTADMPFVRCYVERLYADRLAVYIGEPGHKDAIPSASLTLMFFPYP